MKSIFSIVLFLALQCFAAAHSFAETDPDDPKREIFYWAYVWERVNKVPLTPAEIAYVKIYYWGVNGSTAVKMIKPPLPTRFITAQCAWGNYHVSVVDTEGRESSLKDQVPYYVDKFLTAKGCS